MYPDEDQRAALRRMAERQLIILLDHMGFYTKMVTIEN
jgi:hypothetical protein